MLRAALFKTPPNGNKPNVHQLVNEQREGGRVHRVLLVSAAGWTAQPQQHCRNQATDCVVLFTRVSEKGQNHDRGRQVATGGQGGLT